MLAHLRKRRGDQHRGRCHDDHAHEKERRGNGRSVKNVRAWREKSCDGPEGAASEHRDPHRKKRRHKSRLAERVLESCPRAAEQRRSDEPDPQICDRVHQTLRARRRETEKPCRDESDGTRQPRCRGSSANEPSLHGSAVRLLGGFDGCGHGDGPLSNHHPTACRPSRDHAGHQRHRTRPPPAQAITGSVAPNCGCGDGPSAL
jgi:hypothetical protein